MITTICKQNNGKFCVCFEKQPSNLGPSKCAKFGPEALAVGTQRMNEAADFDTYRSKTAVSGSTLKTLSRVTPAFSCGIR